MFFLANKKINTFDFNQIYDEETQVHLKKDTI